MNVIELYVKMTDVSGEAEYKLANFLNGLKYCDNLQYFKLIVDGLCPINPDILPSYYYDSDSEVEPFKTLKIGYASSVGDKKSIEKMINNANIKKLCNNIEIDSDNNIIVFEIK